VNLADPSVGGTKNVVIVNNRPMTYNRRGELIEVNMEEQMVGSGKPVQEPDVSEIKQHSLLTNSSKLYEILKNNRKPHKGVVEQFKGGIVTKDTIIKKPNLPVRKTQQKNAQRPVNIPKRGWVQSFESGASISLPAETFSSGHTSYEMSLNKIYTDSFKSDFQNYQPITERPRFKPMGYSNENSIVYFYPTQPAKPNLPYYYSTTTTVQPNLNLYDVTTPMPIMDHFMQNLDLYRKILAPNCSFTKNENMETVTEQIYVEITPKPKEPATVKPVRVVKTPAVQPVYADEPEGKLDLFHKCKCKHSHEHSHEHHGHHHHSHEHHGHHHHDHHSHEHHVSFGTRGSMSRARDLKFFCVQGHHHGLLHHLQGLKHKHKHKYKHSEEHSDESEEKYMKAKKKEEKKQVVEHFHHIQQVEKKKKKVKKPLYIYHHHSLENKDEEEEASYYDPLEHKVNAAADLFGSFYNLFENAVVTKNRRRTVVSEEYYDDDDDEDSHGAWSFFKGRRKRSLNDVAAFDQTITEKQSFNALESQAEVLQPTEENSIIDDSSKKPDEAKKKKDKKPQSESESQETEEESAARDEYSEETGRLDEEYEDEYDSEEYYDDSPTNRMPSGNTVGDESFENNAAETNVFDGVFETLGNAFKSLPMMSRKG
jgi:hypothetical protein